MKKLTTIQAIAKCIAVHGDKYDYSRVEYTGRHGKIEIVCPEHGSFWQRYGDHVRGKRCPECASEEARFSIEQFVQRAESVHGNKYDYSNVRYVNNKMHVLIGCPEHGLFKQTPRNHFEGQGCPACGREKLSSAQRDTKDAFIAKAREVHGDRYDYSRVQYVSSRRYITILCTEHGPFEQHPKSHLSGHGCPACGREEAGSANRDTKETFIAKSRIAHSDIYDYSKVHYAGSKTPVTVICPEHGPFEQAPESHTRGHGCPACGNILSRFEQELADYIRSLGFEVIQNDRKLIAPKELDIVVPERKLAIEYNGLYWHSQNLGGKDKKYHLDKTLAAKAAGYRLIHVWEDDDLEVAKSLIAHALGASQLPTVYARKCKIQEIDGGTAKGFLKAHHPQGYAYATTHLGTFHKGTLVAVTSFGRPFRSKLYEHELKRHATCARVVGGLGKVVKHFDRRYMADGELLGSLCDLSRYDGRSYEAAGFKIDDTLPPDYTYVENGRRVHKSKYQKRSIKRLLPECYEEGWTETQMADAAGLLRIYDCGKARYIYGSRLLTH